MKVIKSLDDFKITTKFSGVALGNFDGVHIGHQKLINNLTEICKEKNYKSVVFTFANHPRFLTINNNDQFRQITTIDEKINIIESLGVDYLVIVEFDQKTQHLTPEAFIEELLIDKLNMRYVLCGFNYRFGYKAMGDTVLLETMSKKLGFETFILGSVKIGNMLVSSTNIRKFITHGEIEKANEFLGRQYNLAGVVVHGRGLGKQLGFPTANIVMDNQNIVPNNGVYITETIVHNRKYASITNIGYNPTVGNIEISIENHIFDFDEDIYSETVKVFFCKKIRNEIKFDNLDALINQINIDTGIAQDEHRLK